MNKVCFFIIINVTNIQTVYKLVTKGTNKEIFTILNAFVFMSNLKKKVSINT
jgi:hypothetical protein